MHDARCMCLRQCIRDLHSVLQRLRQPETLGPINWSRVLPSTYSMTMKSTPSCERMSWIVTMFG